MWSGHRSDRFSLTAMMIDLMWFRHPRVIARVIWIGISWILQATSVWELTNRFSERKSMGAS
jgi:hypothetical protein